MAEVASSRNGHSPARNTEAAFPGVETDPLSMTRLADRIRAHSPDNPFFSVEFFPPRTEKGAANFVRLLDHYAEGGPLFCDVTWHAAGDPGGHRPTSSITAAGVALNYCNLDTMLHMICTGLTRDEARRHLLRAKALGIRSILALRGDEPAVPTATVAADRNDAKKASSGLRQAAKRSTTGDFQFAADLVSFIRTEFGSYFSIGVAGYPIPHPDAAGDALFDIECLRRKVAAGADFVITQFFFSPDDFGAFVARARSVGIRVPIIAGLVAINSYRSLCRFAQLAGVPVPGELLARLEPLRDDPAAVVALGLDWLTALARRVLDSRLACGLHFFTLNQPHAAAVVRRLGLWRRPALRGVLPLALPAVMSLDDEQRLADASAVSGATLSSPSAPRHGHHNNHHRHSNSSNEHNNHNNHHHHRPEEAASGPSLVHLRPLPFANGNAFNPSRCDETLRPVFWLCKPKTYVYRTARWTDFPMVFWSPNLTRKLRDSSISLPDVSNGHANGADDATLSFISEQHIDAERLRTALDERVQSLHDLFYRFFESCHESVSGEQSGKAPSADPPTLPGLVVEPDRRFFDICFRRYGRFIRRGLLVLNYLPNYARVPSHDVAHFGWGLQPGFVFQKEYIEFLLEPGLLPKLIKTVTRLPNAVRYLINTPSNKFKNWYSIPENITWGVFNERQLTPALVVDCDLFQIWNAEVFETLLRWLEAVSFDSPAGRMLDAVHSNYLHCALINTQYHAENGTFEHVFGTLFAESGAAQVKSSKAASSDDSNS